jgi:hypothetical protein
VQKKIKIYGTKIFDFKIRGPKSQILQNMGIKAAIKPILKALHCKESN